MTCIRLVCMTGLALLLNVGSLTPSALAQEQAAPQDFVPTPATSLTSVPANAGYWASDGCRYFQYEGDPSWRSDMCMEAATDGSGNRLAHQVGLRPNVGRGLPAAEYLVVWDTSAPEYTTVRFPREPIFGIVQWVRYSPNDPGNPSYQVVDPSTGQPRWVSGAQLPAALAAAAPAQGPKSGSYADKNPAAITAMTIENAKALGAPALLTASSRPCQMSYNGC